MLVTGVAIAGATVLAANRFTFCAMRLLSGMLGHPLAPVRAMAMTTTARAIGIARTGMSAAIDMNAVNVMSEEAGIEATKVTRATVTATGVVMAADMVVMMINAG